MWSRASLTLSSYSYLPLSGVLMRDVYYRFATPSPSPFPRPSGENQGQGSQVVLITALKAVKLQVIHHQ